MKYSDIFGNAKWIKPARDCVDAFFRGSFQAEAGAVTEITICGLGFFRLFINGRRVGDDELAPVTSFYHDRQELYCRDNFGEKIRSRIYAEKYDITPYLTDGENEITVAAGLGWYFEFGSSPVLTFVIRGGGREFVSDEKILWARGSITESNFHRFEYHDYTIAPFRENGIPEDGYTPCVPADIPETEYYYNTCPNDKVIRSVIPEQTGETEDSLIYDVGENITGTYVFTCSEAGKKITVTVGEESGENGLSEKYTQGQASSFVTDGKEREYRLLYTWAAFRYLKISKGARLERVDVIHTPADVNSAFSSGNAVLDWLYDAFIRTQLSNMHAGIPSDCPHLERRGYTGDGRLVCETAMLTLDVKEFYLKWMEDISDCQDEISGHVQYTAPYHHCGGGPGGWGCAIATVPFAFMKHYGDSAPMKKYYPQALRYLDYLESHSENDLVISDQPGLWCLGDWCTPHAVHAQKPEIPEPFVNDYFYIKTIDVLLETSEITGNEDKADYLKAVRERKVKALYDNYFDESTGSFAQNKNGADAFAADIGLGDERTFGNVVRHVREDTPDFGIFGLEICVRLLCERGYVADAVSLLARKEYPSFGFMMDSGATTIWEEWQNPRSMSHPMFGAVTKILFQYILGIRRTENGAGYGKITVSPFVNGVTGDSSGFIMVPQGKIGVCTDMKSGAYKITLPAGITALCRDGDSFVTADKAGTYSFRL